MKIELLFPEVCSMFGEIGTIHFLKKAFKDEKIYETKLFDRPKFLDEDMDFIYIGPSTEAIQEKVIEVLMPYRDEIKKKIEEGLAFFVSGNALELFGNYIKDEDRKIQALGIFDFFAVRDMKLRHNEINLLKYEDLEIVGVKSQFTKISYNKDYSFMEEIKKAPSQYDFKEGVKYKNFYGTQILGPMLILNPDFTKKIFRDMGFEIEKLPFDGLLNEIYEARLKYHREYKKI